MQILSSKYRTMHWFRYERALVAKRIELINILSFYRSKKFKTEKMHESAGYPESSAKFSAELQSKLLNLPEKDLEKCGNKVLDILWFQENVWKETVEFEIPQDQVICGMQANIFKIILKVLSMFFYPDFIQVKFRIRFGYHISLNNVRGQ